MKVLGVVAVLAAALLTAACGDRLAGLAIGDVSGLWTASLYQYSANANSQTRVDLIQSFGATMTMSIVNEEGAPPTVSTVFNDGMGSTTSAAGTVDVLDGTLTLGADTFTIDHDDNRMTIENASALFDFGSGTTSATLKIVLGRI